MSYDAFLEEQSFLSVAFIYEGKSASPDSQTLCPGLWQSLSPLQGESIVHDLCLILKWLCEESALNWIRGSRVRLRQLELISHCGWSVNELVIIAQNRTGAIAFLHGPDGIFPLGGHGTPFHCMNVLQTPDFSNNDKIIAYARTFLHGIYSEDIRLLWVNHPDELPWSNNVDEETLETVVSVIQPPELIIRSKCFEVISTGIYGNGLYRFKLHITPEGNVNMVEDQLLADNLPLRRETFDGIVRVLSDLK